MESAEAAGRAVHSTKTSFVRSLLHLLYHVSISSPCLYIFTMSLYLQHISIPLPLPCLCILQFLCIFTMSLYLYHVSLTLPRPYIFSMSLYLHHVFFAAQSPKRICVQTYS